MPIEPVSNVPETPVVKRHEDNLMQKKRKEKEKDKDSGGKKEERKIDITV